MNLPHYICSPGYWRSARNWSVAGIKSPQSWKLQWRSYRLHQNCSKKLGGGSVKRKKGVLKTTHELTIYISFQQIHSTSREIPAVTQAGLVLKLHLYCFESHNSFMPATNLSKITSKTHKLPRSSKDRLHSSSETQGKLHVLAPVLPSAHSDDSYDFRHLFASPFLCLEASVLCHFAVASQKHTELSISPQRKERRCHGLFLDTPVSTEGKASTEHMKPADASTVSADLCRNLKQPDCLIFWISFSTD